MDVGFVDGGGTHPDSVAGGDARRRRISDGAFAGATPTLRAVSQPATTPVGHLQIERIEKRFDAVEVLRGVSIDVPAGSMCALLGPSGSGKTTLLRVIAGLELANGGRITLDGRVLTGDAVFVRPEKRRIGLVFQDWALFPHLTVAQNVAFGLDRGDTPKRRVGEVLDMVGLDGFADRSPGTLSGGQQQRVALARALAPKPEVLLLDEPFSNLDVSLRVRVRNEVHTLLTEAGVTSVFVTHDQQEAFVLGDQVVVMRDGLVEQACAATELYERPVNGWVAAFVGEANLIDATADGSVVATPFGPVSLHQPVRGAVEVLVRPEHLHIAAGHEAVVEFVEYYGHDTVVVARLTNGRSIRVRATSTTVRVGDPIAIEYCGPATMAYPAAT